MKQPALFVLALMIASPLAAQNQDLGQPVPEGGEVETIARLLDQQACRGPQPRLCRRQT